MDWPQITMIALIAAGFTLTAVKHGEPREPHNMVAYLISVAITVGLLYAGGFWS